VGFVRSFTCWPRSLSSARPERQVLLAMDGAGQTGLHALKMPWAPPATRNPGRLCADPVCSTPSPKTPCWRPRPSMPCGEGSAGHPCLAVVAAGFRAASARGTACVGSPGRLRQPPPLGHEPLVSADAPCQGTTVCCHDGCHVSTLPGRTVDLLASRRAALPVVIPAGQDDKQFAIQLVNQAIFLIDTA
jgi:hypothetical protein